MQTTKLTFICRDSRKEDQHIAMHRHCCHELVFYDRGCHGKTEIGGVKFNFSAGSLAVIPKGIQHMEQHFASGRVLFFGFDTSDTVTPGVYNDMWEVKQETDAIFKEAQEQRSQFQDMIALRLKILLICLNWRFGGDPEPIKNLCYCRNYLEENYMHDISIRNLAKMAGYSYDYFRHLFTERFSLSPQNYLIRIRLEKALQLLKSTDLKCTEVAYLCGFSDSGQMAKMIKREYGLTPTQLRKM